MMKLGDLCGGETERLTAADGLMIDYIDISSVSNESKSIIGKQTLQSREAPSRAQRVIKANDILVSTVRPNLNAVAVYDGSFENLAVASTGFCVLRCKPGVNHRFVFNICKSNAFIKAMTEQATGASYPAVNEKIIRAFDVPDLDYESQTRIAGRLDNIQIIIDLRKQQLRELDDLIKTRFVEMFDGGDYPKTTIADLVAGKVSSAKKDFAQDDAIRYIDISSIDNQRNTMTGYTEYVLSEAPSRAQQHIIKGDILISTVRPNLRNVAMTTYSDNNLVASSGFCVLRASKYLPSYLMAIVCSDEFTEAMCRVVTGANYPAIKDSDVLSYTVPVPPMGRQREFEAFTTQVDKSKLSVQSSIDYLETLKQSLMQKYFG